MAAHRYIIAASSWDSNAPPFYNEQYRREMVLHGDCVSMCAVVRRVEYRTGTARLPFLLAREPAQIHIRPAKCGSIGDRRGGTNIIKSPIFS